MIRRYGVSHFYVHSIIAGGGVVSPEVSSARAIG